MSKMSLKGQTNHPSMHFKSFAIFFFKFELEKSWSRSKVNLKVKVTMY